MRTYEVLIVDDSDLDCRHYRKLLATNAPDICDITCVPDGAAGLAALKDRPFDCVLLDFNLPDMTGLEFLTEAAGGGELPCAVVLLTGHGSEAVAVEAMKRGALDYLVKDIINERRLWRVLRVAVAQNSLRHKLAATLHDLTIANAALEDEAAIRIAAEAELRRARDAAEHANRAKTHFVAMVTHELRTPLNGILGYAQLLRLENELPPQQDTRVEAMMQAGRHLLEMIDRVLDFASIESGRLDLDPKRVRIEDIVSDCIAFIRPTADEHRLSLQIVTAPEAPIHIVADAGRLRQVLLNLLGNALRFTRDGCVELRIMPGATPGLVRFEVTDTGLGVEQDTRTRLLQDFAELGAMPAPEGPGLGLAIAARIVGLMGGTIGHEIAPEDGSLFWLELPSGQIVRAVPQDQTASALTAGRILLVDDIAMNRDVIGAFMRAAGYNATLADNGATAVQLATEQNFDLILMDIRMPDMDGLEATRRIRKLPPPSGRVPILGLSAFALLDQVAECRAAGMDGHLAKPVDYAVLASTINDTIARVAAQA